MLRCGSSVGSQIDAADLKELYELSKIQTDKLLTAEEGCGLFKCGNQFINFDGRIEQGYIYDLADTKPKDHEEIHARRTGG